MKTKSISLLLLCLFLLPICASAAELDADDLTLGGIHLGDTSADVERIYGAPVRIRDGAQGFLNGAVIPLRTCDYGNTLHVRFDLAEDRVYDVMIGAPSDDLYDTQSDDADTGITTARAIHIGSSRADLEAAYGTLPAPLVDHRAPPTCAYIYAGTDGKLAFYITPERSLTIHAIHLIAEKRRKAAQPRTPANTEEPSEHEQMRRNFLAPSDAFLAELAAEQSLPYTIGKEGTSRFYADNGRPIYPANDGAVGHIATITLRAGSVILTRYGAATGRYVSPAGTPFEQRALPTTTDESDFHTYIVCRNIEGVEKGKIAPWFGQAGGGIQYKLPDRISNLLDGAEPFLEEVESDDRARSGADSQAA